MPYQTLEDALRGSGPVERTFHCPNPDHEDRHASASVNIAKGVWCCYACGSSGRVDAEQRDFLPYIKSLTAQREDDVEAEVRPEHWLFQFAEAGPYWSSRFSPEAIKHFNLRHDFARNRAVYPMRNSAGGLIGVVSRLVDGRGSRYMYPRGSRVSKLLFNYTPEERDVVVLTEGATDTIALWEAGIDAFACYGSKLSDRQATLIRRCHPQHVICAFDMDQAGMQGWKTVQEHLGPMAIRARWEPDEGDLADMPVDRRRIVIEKALHSVTPVL